MHAVLRVYGILPTMHQKCPVARWFASIFLKIMVILSCESKYEAEKGTHS